MGEAPEYGRIAGRVVRILLGLLAVGAVAFLIGSGTMAAASFLAGGAVSGASFWLLHRLVRDLTAPAEGRRVSAPSIVLHAFRLLILGGLVYACLHVAGLRPGPLAAGIAMPVTAITVEALLEWSRESR